MKYKLTSQREGTECNHVLLGDAPKIVREYGDIVDRYMQFNADSLKKEIGLEKITVEFETK